jgi:type II secretory pathway predicted ATPase ExeA
MTHPLFRQELFIETTFARRCQAMLRLAWHQRSWHVIVADPGAGKSMSIRDLRRMTGSPALLVVTAPKNDESEQALGNQLFTALGLPLRGRWSERKPRLMGYLHQYGTECLIVDDAHDLELAHLLFLKELTDQGRLQYDHPLGLCLVAAGRGNTIPLKETLDQPDPTWLQFRRRLDKLEPFCRVASHTSEEVREILATLETAYQPLFPQLNLRQWTGSIYTWLTQPVLDPTHSGRVTMDYLMKLVTTALEWSYQAEETDLRAETLEQAASLLVLRRDTLRIIDGAGPSVEVPPSESTAEVRASGTEAEHVPPGNLSENRTQARRARTELVDQAPSIPHEHTTSHEAREDQKHLAKPTKCMFAGVVPIDSKRFLDSGTALVECPECASLRTLAPRSGVLRFPAHDQRKTRTPNSDRRWALGEAAWEVTGGEGTGSVQV